MKNAFIYLISIIVAELITTFYNPLWGIGIHTAILLAVIIHASLVRKQTQSNFILSLTIIPLIRILSLSMPIADIPQIWWLPIIYLPLLAAAIVLTRFLKYRPKEIGLTLRFIPFQLLVAITGIAFGVVEYFILKPDPWIAKLTIEEAWLPSILFLLTTGLVEEFIFRGILQKSASDYLHKWGIIYVSLLFAVLHIGFQSFPDMVFVFFMALLFAWIAKRTGSLLGVTLCHGVINIMLFIIMPFLF